MALSGLFNLLRRRVPSSPGKIVEEVCSIVVGLISRAGGSFRN